MLNNKKTKKRTLFLLAFLIGILLINLAGAVLIKSKISKLLLKNKTPYYSASIEGVEFGLFRKSLVLKNVFLTPSKESVASLMEASSEKRKIENVTLSSMHLNGFSYWSLIFNNRVELKSLTLNNLNIHTFENSKITAQKEESKAFDIDSIYLKDLNGLAVRNININNLNYQVFDFATNEIVYETKPISFKSSGIILEKLEGRDHLYKLKPAKRSFEIKNIFLDLDEKQYDFSVGSIQFDFDQKFIAIKDLIFKPQIDKYKLADTYTYNDDIFDVNLGKLTIYNFDFGGLVKGNGLLIDSVYVAQLNLELFKDKSKPFDKTKRPGLPHTGLKTMDFPLFIGKVKIDDSDVVIQENIGEKDLMMEVPINNITAEIHNITSIDSLRNDPLEVRIEGDLMGSCKTHVQASFPLKNHQNTFYFSGTLGASKLRLFDTALFPALGLKVLEGDLDSLSFKASANTVESRGEMTMLYHNLEADVFKNKSTEENQFLSWTVNALVHNSNPKKNKEPRHAAMHFERVAYKGLGNYFWKTLQNGLINTIAPGGKHVKKEKNKKNK